VIKKKIACIFNYAPHYRSSIYSLLDQHLNCDFYFGGNLRHGKALRKMEMRSLKGFKRESRVLYFRYHWQFGYPWLSIFKYSDFILTGNASLSNVCFVLLCSLLKKRVFLWGHGIKTEKEKRYRLLRVLFKYADGFFLYSDFGKSMMKASGYPEEKLFVVYNSLNYGAQIKVREFLKPSGIYRAHFNNAYPVAIFIGRLLPNKQLDMLIKAQ
jgi:glycosyltransferase involved in cell wall biosynthesis